MQYPLDYKYSSLSPFAIFLEEPIDFPCCPCQRNLHVIYNSLAIDKSLNATPAPDLFLTWMILSVLRILLNLEECLKSVLRQLESLMVQWETLPKTLLKELSTSRLMIINKITYKICEFMINSQLVSNVFLIRQ